MMLVFSELIVFSMLMKVLRCADQEGLKVALHVEPYEGRNAVTLRRDLEYASKTYGEHPAMQKHKGRIVYYLYDSYREPAAEWAKLFNPTGPQTVRKTALDGTFLCLLLDRSHMQYAVDAHCDGYCKCTHYLESCRRLLSDAICTATDRLNDHFSVVGIH